jgi:hypothetical protein
MKSIAASIALLVSFTSIGLSTNAFAEVCYDAGGTVNMENVTSTLQIGSIDLILSEAGKTVFDEHGSLVGNITGTDGYGVTILSHKARFPQGDSFVTAGDTAVLVEPFVRLYDESGGLLVDAEGNPCSFWIHETITEIKKGTRFFNNVTSVSISADGYVSNCPTENKNFFELSGSLCIE